MTDAGAKTRRLVEEDMPPKLILMLAGALTLAAAGTALAQVPPDVAAKIAAIGRKVDPEGTALIYAPLQPKPPYKGVTITRDIAYGPGPKDTLDLVVPEKAGRNLPVLIFVHGGAFVGGDKNKNAKGEPSPFYDNIMLWAVAHGMIGVNINYQTAPAATYPEVQKDIAAAIGWVQKNAAAHGGNPRRVFIWGHSAGATHVASYVSHPEFYPAGGSGLAGAVMSSATYQLDGPGPDGKVRDHVYFGPAATLAERSAEAGLVKTTTPLFIANAELDPLGMVASAKAMNEAKCKAGKCPTYKELKDHGHMSESYAVNTADVSLTDPVLAFMKAAN
jgi:acetyl esterase/lipase